MTLPPFPRAARGTPRDGVLVLDDMGDDVVVLRLQQPGFTHRVVVGAAAIAADGTVGLDGVFDDLGADAADTAIGIGSRSDGATPARGPWEAAARVRAASVGALPSR